MARNRFDVDEILESSFNYSQFKRILHYVKPYRKTLFCTLLLLIAGAALQLLSPMILREAINRAIPQKRLDWLFFLSLAFVAIIVISALFSHFRMRQMNETGQAIIHDIRLDMFKHLQTLSFDYFDSRPHGKILTRLINYVDAISDLLSNGLVSSVVDLFTLVIIVIYMGLMDPLLTLYALAGLPFMFALIFLLKKFQRRAQQRLNAKSANLNAYTQESIEGNETTAFFARQEVNRRIFHTLGAQYYQNYMHLSRLNMLLWPTVDSISNFTVLFLYLAAALWLRGRYGGATDVGTMVAFVDYARRFWGPIINLANFYNQFLSGASYIERIFEFLDEKATITDAPGAGRLEVREGTVCFENVSFSYEAGKPILENLSFEVKAGETIALVGPTGAGKTTVLNLLSRFYDVDSGRILIDGTDIARVTTDSLRKNMGVMLQEPFLFPGTILENIRYGKLEADDEECKTAVRNLRAEGRIEQYEEGYAREIHEKGGGVSNGERQLISFARVILSDPKILILDEATSSIDTRSEKALQEALEVLMKGRTCFVVAHRLSTIQNADRIFYIGDGGILEQGTHEELLRQNGLYAALHKAQLSEMALRSPAK